VSDLRDGLAHVLWIGGAPRVGKTTLSRLLAGKYDLKLYNLDWHQVREHRDRGGPAMRWWDERTLDGLWVDSTPAELLERSIAAWNEGFELVIQDLLALPPFRTIVAEGPGALPRLVAPLIRDRSQAIFLVPTLAVWEGVLAGRGAVGADRTRDPARGRLNLRERDARFEAAIAGWCDELGLRWVRLDGGLSLDASLALIEEHFGPHLPKELNV